MNPIRRALEITGLTQEELAKRLGISRQTLVNYENNPGKIPTETLIDISEITSISVNELASCMKKRSPRPILPLFMKKKPQKRKSLLTTLMPS